MRRVRYVFMFALVVATGLPGCGGDEGGSCDTDKYPVAPEGAAATLHVSSGCSAEEADGSAARPYPTINAAVAAASDGTAVLIAPGTYPEHIKVTKRVALIGSSSPTDPAAAAVEIAPSDEPFTNCEGMQTRIAICVCDAPGTVIRGLRVSRAVAGGIKVTGGSLTIEGTVVEETQTEGANYGHGVIAVNGAELSLQHSLVTGSGNVGVFVTGARGIILQNTIRDGGGPGIRVDTATGEVEIKDNALENNTQLGIGVFSSRAIILQNTIRGTRPDGLGIGDGFLAGVLTLNGGAIGPESDVTLEDNVLDGNARVGALFGAGTRMIILQRNELRNNAGQAQFGAGVWIQGGAGNHADTRLEGNQISNNRFVGVGITGNTRAIILQNNQVSGTAAATVFAGAEEVTIGDGVGLFSNASAQILNNKLLNNGRFGLILDGANGEETLIKDNQFEQNNDSAIILQNQIERPDTDQNLFDAAGSVQSVPPGTFGVRTEEFTLR